MTSIDSFNSLSFNDGDPLWNVLMRFVLTLVVFFILLWGIYYRINRRSEELFAFSLIGIIVFFICILLKTVEVQMGMTFGLFAIFALMSFRSKKLSLKTLAYFFAVIGISVINAMAVFHHPIRGSLLINSIIILVALLLEKYNPQKLLKFELIYENFEVLARNDDKELMADIARITGKEIVKVEIAKVDLIKKQIELIVYFK